MLVLVEMFVFDHCEAFIFFNSLLYGEYMSEWEDSSSKTVIQV